MKKIISLIKYHTQLLFRDLNSVMFSFIMPIGFYLLFANMLKGMPTGDNSIQELLIPLYTIIIIGNAVLNVFGILVAQAKETGNLTKYKFLGIKELIFSATLYSATIIFQFSVIVSFLIFTQIYAKIHFPISQIIPIMIVLILINIYQFAISYFLNALINKSSLYSSVALTFYMFQMFLGGLTFPLEMFPEMLRNIIYVINPIVYGRNALIDVWVNRVSLVDTVSNLLILLAASLLLFIIGRGLNILNEKGKTCEPI